jgi:pheromone shutdown protein TraB
MYVLMLEGWEESKGMKEEIEMALELKIPITYIDKDCNYIVRKANNDRQPTKEQNREDIR